MKNGRQRTLGFPFCSYPDSKLRFEGSDDYALYFHLRRAWSADCGVCRAEPCTHYICIDYIYATILLKENDKYKLFLKSKINEHFTCYG